MVDEAVEVSGLDVDPAEDLADDLPESMIARVDANAEAEDDVEDDEDDEDLEDEDEDDEEDVQDVDDLEKNEEDDDEEEDEEDDDEEDDEEEDEDEPAAERAPGEEPELPEDIDPRDLDPEIRSELRTLTGPINAMVSKRLVASGLLLDEDPEESLAHAMVARRLAPRVASVREAVGLAAYHTEQWAMAIAELRTYHRITGRQTHLAIIADCERALGRPEKAVDLYRAANLDKLEPDEAIELLIVAAGARGDMGQYDAAVSMLQIPDLQDDDAPWAARLRYAYADTLLAAGRPDQAREWFAKSADVDEDVVTDAAERLLDLDGVTFDEPTGSGSTDAAHVRNPEKPTESADPTRPGHALIFTEPPTPPAGDQPDHDE